MKAVRSQVRNAVMTLDVGEFVFIGPYSTSGAVHASIGKYIKDGDCKENATFKLETITGVTANHDKIYRGIFKIERTN